MGIAAHVADVTQAHRLLHGHEQHDYGDAGYMGVEKREDVLAAHPQVEWRVAQKRGQVAALPPGEIKLLTQELKRRKASVWARVEHAFHVLKCRFGYRKVRYRSLAKNTSQLQTLFALANLVLARTHLLMPAGS